MYTKIVTIKGFEPLFLKETKEPASNIQYVLLEELGWKIVANKSLYSIGDKAVYVLPDAHLGHIPLFESFIAPNGNKSKSRLGTNNRVKAVAFNSFLDANNNRVYSNGILIPMQEVLEYLSVNTIEDIDLDTSLNITKPDETEFSEGDDAGNLPSGLSKSDETNIEALDTDIDYNEELILTLKIDGSSAFLALKPNIEGVLKLHIGSRAKSKKIFIKHEVAIPFDNPLGIGDEGKKVCKRSLKPFKSGNKVNTIKGFETNERGVLCASFEEDNTLADITILCQYTSYDDDVLSDSVYIQLLYPLYEKLKDCNSPIALRCEIYGEKLKGSGNKYNPHAKLPKGVAVYGIEEYNQGVAIPLSMNEVTTLCKQYDLPMVDIIYKGYFQNKEELQNFCNNYFNNNMVEGLVLRYSNNTSDYLSCKIMNPDYDFRKQ